MKFKEIIRNKWGWTSAIVYTGILIWSMVENIQSICINYLFYPSLLIGGRFGTGQMWDFSGLIWGVISVPIIGFILGLLLQKIWRKFK